MKLISLTTDFGPGTQGVGIMHAVAYDICPDVRMIDLCHNVTDYSITDGARQMETALWLPKGVHVCVVDPGVGSRRRIVALRVARGDTLIGPDNGVLIPAARRFGGIVGCWSIENPAVMGDAVSNTFHGRDIMVPAAAHLHRGVPCDEFGPALNEPDLVPATYSDLACTSSSIEVKVIHINKYGTICINLLADDCQLWMQDALHYEISAAHTSLIIQKAGTFGDVPEGAPLIFADDYGRISVAINKGSFAKALGVSVDDKIRITKVKAI